MAKSKKGAKKTSYVSKGERPSVERSILKIGRCERRANPTNASIFQRLEHRNYVMSRKNDPDFKKLRDRYLKEEAVKSRAMQLFTKFSSAGATWAACVQAVKTDFVPSFENRWIERKDAQK